MRFVPVLSLIVLAAPCTWGHDQIPGTPQRVPIAIVDATIHPVSGPVIERGAILFDQGRVTAVGRDIDVPPGAERIDGRGMFVYPGLFDAYTDLGLREIGAVRATLDVRESGPENPNVRSWTAVNPDSELIPVARSGGVLLAHVAPSGPFLRGQSAVMQLDGWTSSEMLLRGPAMLHVDWPKTASGEAWWEESDEHSEAEPDERLRRLDELFKTAARYAAAREERPEAQPVDVRLEALMPALRGEIPLLAEADRQAEIEAAVALAARHRLRLVIYGGYDAAECAALLKAHEVPVIVAGTYRLPLRRSEPYDTPYTLPERLRRAGVTFCIAGQGTGGASNVRNLPYQAANAAAYGLPEADAVRAITLAPAEILGVADRTGSLEVGKDATLIVTDGNVLETEANVQHAFIQGRRVDLGDKHKSLYRKYQEKYRR